MTRRTLSMLRSPRRVWALCLLGVGAVGVACSESPEGSTAPSEAPILLSDANNFSSSAVLDVPSFEVAADPELRICWSGAEEDLLCHPLNPDEDVKMVTFLRFSNLSELEVERRLASGDLTQSVVSGVLEYHTTPGETCARLSDFDFQGTKVDLEAEFTAANAETFLLLFSAGSRPGVGTRTLAFLRPDNESTEREVSVPGGCGTLDYSADLEALDRVEVPAHGPWQFDWRSLTRDGAGNAVLFQSIDRVLVAFYAGRDLSTLERNIFDIESEATSTWELSLDGGRSADLADAVSKDTGEQFDGFAADEPGLWLLALTCSTCTNPAPQLLTVLTPVGG